MNTYKEQLQAVQEFAFDILKKFPIDKTATTVLSMLADASNQERILFFELNQGEEARKVYYELAHSGSVAKWLENHSYLASIGL